MSIFPNIVEQLQSHAASQSEAIAYRYLHRGESEASVLSYGELYDQARKAASYLSRRSERGDRICLVFSPGPETVIALLACLLSGRVVVPLPEPRPNRTQGHLFAALKGTGCRLVIATPEVMPRVSPVIEKLGPDKIPRIVTTEELIGADCTGDLPTIEADDLAIIQYTSGSTSRPRGVCVSHANLAANEMAISRAFDSHRGSRMVSWLPMYHDMGLIGALLQPLYSGYEVIHMSPLAFVQRPIRWLRAISHYKATISGGPNFAYALCSERITDSQCEGLDLSSWRIAFNGSEPVQRRTLEDFQRRFSNCGLREDALFPCYGMAEATLYVSGARYCDEPDTSDSEFETVFQQNASIASSGVPPVDTEVAIVCPDTMTALPEGKVGEIWIHGPAVSSGYWGNKVEENHQFARQISGARNGKRFHSTGDLGYLRNGHLYVCGRRKEMLIVRGQNLYPFDIEAAAANSDSRLAKGSIACFNPAKEGPEELAIAAELRNFRAIDTRERDAIKDAIRQAISSRFDVVPTDVLLLKPGGIPRTSSGKLKRLEVRQLYLDGKLEDLAGARESSREATAS